LVVGHHSNGCSRRDDLAGHGDLHVNPVADAVALGEALDLNLEALLCLDRHGLCACQSGPDGEKAAIGAEVEHPSRPRHGESGAQVDVPAVHLACPGGVGRRKRDHHPARRPEARPGPRPDTIRRG